jgi:hypothetical protein
VLNLTIKFDDRAVRRFLTDVEKKAVPYAVRAALNETGRKIKEAERREIDRAFDRPTPRTKNSVFFKSATKDNMTATVWIKDRAGDPPPVRWLFPQITGTPRGWKAFEKSLQYVGILPKGWFAIPGAGAPLDQYGNVPSGFLRQLLSQLRARRVGGYEARTGGAENDRNKRRRTLLRQGFRLFAISQPGQRLKPGVYSADLFGKNITPVLYFTSKAPRYRPRFRFYEVGQQVAKRELTPTFHRKFTELASRFAREGLR